MAARASNLAAALFDVDEVATGADVSGVFSEHPTIMGAKIRAVTARTKFRIHVLRERSKPMNLFAGRKLEV